MADYYSLLARAVGALPDPNPEARRAIYERARRALLNQLRQLDPPTPEIDILRENDALDLAIARLEAERLPPPDPAPSPDPPPPLAADPLEQEPIAAVAPTGLRMRVRAETAAAAKPAAEARRGWTKIVAGALLGLVVAGVAIAAYVLPNPPFDALRSKPPAAPAAKAVDPKANKIIERVSGGQGAPGGEPNPDAAGAPPASGAAKSAADAAANPNPPLPVEQRAALLLQQPGEGQNVKVFIGSVVWRLDTVSRGPGQTAQTAVRADIDIAEAKFKASLVFQNNLDPTFSASHTLQLRMTLGPDSPAVGFKAIRVPEMREEGAQTGAALTGAPATIKENFFLVALQQSEAAVTRNQDLIRSRPWLDVPMQTVNDRLSKLAIEKGPTGERIIKEALEIWQK